MTNSEISPNKVPESAKQSQGPITAFPHPFYANKNGMDLRDYFAALAMSSFITTVAKPTDDTKKICNKAYKFADQMMETRKK